MAAAATASPSSSLPILFGDDTQISGGLLTAFLLIQLLVCPALVDIIEEEVDVATEFDTDESELLANREVVITTNGVDTEAVVDWPLLNTDILVGGD